MSEMKKIMKSFKSLDRWVKYLLGVCIVLLLVSLLWPRKQSMNIRLVPVDQTSYYKAVLEGFSDDDKVNECLTNGKPAFVAFVADWCGYCKKLKPSWVDFEQNYKGTDCNVISIECTKYKDLAKKHNISGYPTIKYLPKGLDDPSEAVDYSGDRTSKGFLSFLSQYH